MEKIGRMGGERGALPARRLSLEGARTLIALGTMAIAVAAAFGAVRPIAQESALTACLPAADEAAGWRPDGEPQVFAGEDLFIYIDGGADIYEEYGFREVAVQDYAGPGGRSLSVEIFAMSGPAAAYGMYTFKAGAEGRAVEIGAGGRLDSYYLNFWEGPYLVTITGFDEEAATRDGILAVAGALDRRIEAAGERPALADCLPAEGLNPSSLQYIRGPLGLNNVHVFFTDRRVPFEEGVKGEYRGGVRLLLLRSGSVREAAALFRSMSEGFGSSPKYRDRREVEGGLVQAVDNRGLTITAAAREDLVLVAFGASAATARDLFERVRE